MVAASQRELTRLASGSAAFDLQKRVVADAALIGTTEERWLLASDAVDLLQKGHSVRIWNRSSERAGDAARRLAAQGFKGQIEVATDLERTVRESDVVSAATNSRVPLIHGAWLKPGAHVDLIGAFTPEMRETDDQAVARARVFVDVKASAMQEAGDLLQPMRAGAIGADHVKGDLADLLAGRVTGRTSPQEITLLKSCGAALEDLAAAIHVFITSGPAS